MECFTQAIFVPSLNEVSVTLAKERVLGKGWGQKCSLFRGASRPVQLEQRGYEDQEEMGQIAEGLVGNKKDLE